MAMTVRQLIKKLEKFPSTAKIAWVAHDQDAEVGEFDGTVQRVDAAPPALRARGFGVILG